MLDAFSVSCRKANQVENQTRKTLPSIINKSNDINSYSCAAIECDEEEKLDFRLFCCCLCFADDRTTIVAHNWNAIVSTRHSWDTQLFRKFPKCKHHTLFGLRLCLAFEIAGCKPSKGFSTIRAAGTNSAPTFFPFILSLRKR